MPTYFKTLNTGSISAGSTVNKDWTPDTDIIIRKVMLIEKNDQSLSNVDVTITIADVPFTRDYVPGSALGTDPEYCWKPDLEVSKGSKILFSIKNNTSSSVNIDIVIEYEKR